MLQGRSELAVEDRLAHLMTTWGDRLIRFAYVYAGGDRHLAQDIAQETFVRSLEKMRRHADAEIRPSWLFTVARNVALDEVRRRERQGRALLRVSPGPAAAEDLSDGLIVRQVVNSLPDTDRTCLLLFYFADQTAEEVAAELDVSVAVVKSRLHRARQRFAAAWKEPLPHPNPPSGGVQS